MVSAFVRANNIAWTGKDLGSALAGDQAGRRSHSECMRMNKALKFAALAALPLTAVSVAYAQSVQHDVNLSATVPSFCTVDNPNTSSSLVIDVNQQTGAVSPLQKSVTIGQASCNAVATVSSTSSKGGLKNSNTALPIGFTNVIQYKGDVYFAGFKQSTINTPTTQGSVGTTGGAEGGDLRVTVTPTVPSLPLTQGNYSDTITVTITPQ